ncbi:hypothetical protein L1987_46153 [Smallanthus sonchifolius]|uniref:Uncharacterized protein n=1 Tax=Smallanthus sonchifolius TaxID=185202 RepID=A0ACB9FYZ9_9ASTR|nr:hypothetical protein L1987_46153 [Smallanthus sonchifolius]
MVHAGIAFAIFVLYGISKLLEEYLRPILWLNSPSRNSANPSFVLDRTLGISRKKKSDSEKRKRSGFSILLRWLVSFWVFVMAYEQSGVLGVVTLLGLGFMFTSTHVKSTMRLNYAVKVLVTFGAQKVPDSLVGNITDLDVKWIIVHSKHASDENKLLLLRKLLKYFM